MRRKTVRQLLQASALTTALVSALHGCTSGSSGGVALVDGGGATDGAASDGASDRVCATGQAKLWGTLDGVPFEQTYASTGFTISGDVRASLGTYGKLRMARTSTYDSEQPVKWALLVMPREGPYADQMFCAGPTSPLTHERSPITFRLRQLQLDPRSRGTFTAVEMPDSGTCEGTAVSGEIEGCVGPGR